MKNLPALPLAPRIEFDAKALSTFEEFGRHVCQDLIATMRDTISQKCQELSRAAKKGEFDDFCAHASADIWEMKRVIREAEILQGDITGCLVNWLEKRGAA